MLFRSDREHAMNLINSNIPEGHTTSSVSFPGGSASFKAVSKKGMDSGQQFGGVGGDTSSQAATNLE